jgi:phosphatidylserine decarboxylase
VANSRRTNMMRVLIDSVFQQEQINFLLTNRIPRRLVTRFMGWFSQIEQPLVRDLSIGVWKAFAGDLNLDEARKTRFTSLHDCFIRELEPGSRPIDNAPDTLVSPCDGIVGASGRLRGGELLQAKGLTYTLADLVGDAALAERYRDGCYVTLRLTSTMYHRFHAPEAGEVERVTYISGDTWNVNPIAVKRIERLYCRNERAVVHLRVRGSGELVLLVPVAAILVASICFNFLPDPLDLRHRGVNQFACRATFGRGEEMGHFRHGSTIIVLGSQAMALCDHVREGVVVRMGQQLLRHR